MRPRKLEQVDVKGGKKLMSKKLMSKKSMSKEERAKCQEKKLRAVLVSALPVTDLEPILGQYGPHLKVLIDLIFAKKSRMVFSHIYSSTDLCLWVV